MKVTLKLFATLAHFLPPGAEKNEISVEVSDDATVADVIHAHALPLERCHLVLVDGVYIEPSARSTFVLQEGQALAIWPPVAGG